MSEAGQPRCRPCWWYGDGQDPGPGGWRPEAAALLGAEGASWSSSSGLEGPQPPLVNPCFLPFFFFFFVKRWPRYLRACVCSVDSVDAVHLFTHLYRWGKCPVQERRVTGFSEQNKYPPHSGSQCWKLMRTGLYSGEHQPVPLLPWKVPCFLSNSDRCLPNLFLETSSEVTLLSPGKSMAVLTPPAFFLMSKVNLLLLLQSKPRTSFMYLSVTWKKPPFLPAPTY